MATGEGTRKPRSPAYHRLYVLLAEQIRDGVYAPSDLLPSELQLAEQYGCSRVTVRRALDLLQQDELVTKHKGQGTVVRVPRAPGTASAPLRGRVSDLVASGIELSAEELFWGVVTAPALVARQLRLEPMEECLLVRRVRRFEETPVSYTSIYVPSHVGELLGQEDVKDRLILELLDQTSHRPVDTEHTLTATLADGQVAEHLDLPIGAPVLRMRGVAFDERGTPVYFQESLYHPDQFEYTVHLKRGETGGTPEWRSIGDREIPRKEGES